MFSEKNWANSRLSKPNLKSKITWLSEGIFIAKARDVTRPYRWSRYTPQNHFEFVVSVFKAFMHTTGRREKYDSSKYSFTRLN